MTHECSESATARYLRKRIGRLAQVPFGMHQQHYQDLRMLVAYLLQMFSASLRHPTYASVSARRHNVSSAATLRINSASHIPAVRTEFLLSQESPVAMLYI
jgi:hypothetical protein